MSLVNEQAVLAPLGQQQHPVEEERVPGCLGAAHPEATLGDELAVRGEIGPRPAVEQRLYLLNADRVLVPALHVVYVGRDAGHRSEGALDRRPGRGGAAAAGTGGSGGSIVLALGLELLRQVLRGGEKCGFSYKSVQKRSCIAE